MTWGDPISRELEVLHQRFVSNTEGDVATYIPELSSADPGHFGIALMGLGGRTYTAGDTDIPFTIQSVSKPFVFAMVLDALGLETVTERVGVEPSGEGFNAISLETGSGRPANPMINAGAIMVTSLVLATGPQHRFERIRDGLSRFAGRELDVDEAVYRSELQTGDRSRALAYLMRSAGALRDDVDETLDTYFRQCAIRVTATDIAAMGATLANRGVHPVTGETVVGEATAGYVLTVMATCGMYDYSGNWLLRVGLPAKSGVSGALVAVSPDQFGIGLYSPLLDAKGNSVRGVAACKELSSRFGLGMMQRSGRAANAVYATAMDEVAAGWIGRDGTLPEGVVLRALQGDLDFTDVEGLLVSLDAHPQPGDDGPLRVVLDLHRVGVMSRAAAAMLHALVSDLIDAGHHVEIVDVPERELVLGIGASRTLEAALRQIEEYPRRDRNHVPRDQERGGMQ